MTPQQEQEIQYKNTLVAILLSCVGYALFNVTDVIIKYMAGQFHFTQVVFMGSCFLIVFFSGLGFWREGKKAFKTSKPKWMLLRALLAQVCIFCNVLALPHITLSVFYTLVFVSPFLMALLSAVFMNEKLDKWRTGVILFGFTVVLWVFQPGSGLLNIWTVLVLLSALAYATQLLVVRHIGLGESRYFIYLSGAVLNFCLLLPFVAAHFVMPSLLEWALFAFMAACAALAFLSIGYSVQLAPSAATVAPYHYTQIIWGALLGWFFFAEIPEMRVMVGSAAIIMAGLVLVYKERRKSALSPS